MSELRRLLDKAHACVQRVDHGAGTSLTLDEAIAAVEHPLGGVASADLRRIIAYLACQVVGYQHSVDMDARLAMANIGSVVDSYRSRHRGGAA